MGPGASDGPSSTSETVLSSELVDVGITLAIGVTSNTTSRSAVGDSTSESDVVTLALESILKDDPHVFAGPLPNPTGQDRRLAYDVL